jgi:hypothetical protein
MISAPFRPPFISIIGGCQVSGLAAAARALLPEAIVTAWHVGVDHASSVDTVAAALDGSDLILSQFDETEARQPLRPSVIRASGLKVVAVPGFGLSRIPSGHGLRATWRRKPAVLPGG